MQHHSFSRNLLPLYIVLNQKPMLLIEFIMVQAREKLGMQIYSTT